MIVMIINDNDPSDYDQLYNCIRIMTMVMINCVFVMTNDDDR